MCSQPPGDNYPGIDYTATPIERLLAEYFGIDLAELRREKDRMYETLCGENLPTKGKR